MMNGEEAGISDGGCPGSLFGESGNDDEAACVNEADCAIASALHSAAGLDMSALPEHARRLYELSVNAFDAIVHAWMSELPISAEIVRFGKKILAATADAPVPAGVTAARGKAEEAQRRAADMAATDRGDPDVRIVQEAAYKVWHEIHRLTGLLRFSPNQDGVYTARCEPDYGILPALGPHFRERFGETSWIIIDEKRRLFLRCLQGQPPECASLEKNAASPKAAPDGEWEDLWRLYHTTINNESRNNPDLQRQFMPRRYWKYLTELL